MTIKVSVSHSPLPWRTQQDEYEGEHWLWIETETEDSICSFSDPDEGIDDTDRANAAYIVQAVNAYPQLVEAAAVLRDWYRMFRPVMRPGTEGEALLERTTAALGIDLMGEIQP